MIDTSPEALRLYAQYVEDYCPGLYGRDAVRALRTLANLAQPVECRCDGQPAIAPECDGAGCEADRINEARASQPAAVPPGFVVVPLDFDVGSPEFNDAAWAFIEHFDHNIPTAIWNDLKPALAVAVKKWLSARPAVPAQPAAEPQAEHWKARAIAAEKKLVDIANLIAAQRELAGNVDPVAMLWNIAGIADGVPKKFVISARPAVPAEGGVQALLERAVKALADLSFECDGVTRTQAPTPATYNRTLGELQEIRRAMKTASAQPAAEPQAPAFAYPPGAVVIPPGADLVITGLRDMSVAEPQAPAAVADELADDIVRSVAELPDRSSPEGWPEAMLVTQAELRDIVIEAIARYEASRKGGA